MYKFIFDLDGTVTAKETLPLIADHFGIREQIDSLTKETIKGNIPFIESFIKRIHILGEFNILEINKLLISVPLYQKVHKFISENSKICSIATGNVDCWINGLSKKIGVKCFCSEAEVNNNKIVRLTKILRKENVVKEEQNLGNKVVFIGDGNNDMEAMRIADISIASGITHTPAPSILSIADYAVFNEEALCRLLNQLL